MTRHDRTDLIRAGRCAAWPLPADERCPRQARHLLVTTARALKISARRIDDAELMVSELATNAVAYSDHPELWLYLRGQGSRAALIVSVFDGGDGFAHQRRSATLARALEIGGWGLYTVDKLAGPSYWGHHLSRSHLHQTPGAVTWFSIPVSARLLASATARLGAADGIFRLAAQVTARGVQHVRATHEGRTARLWVGPDLEIHWRLGHIYCSPLWRPQQAFMRTAADFADAVEEIIRLHEASGFRQKTHRLRPPVQKVLI